MSNAQELIAGYLDETLSPDQHAEFARWLQASPDNRKLFADAVLLHDRLCGEMQSVALMAYTHQRPAVQPAPAAGRTRRTLAAIGVAAVATIAVVVYLNAGGETPAAAAAVELNRLIATSASASDRTYRIAVEDVAPEMPHAKRPEARRPPKPSMQGAVLHVRHGNQFVLIRRTPEGLPFVTGSNGQTSWAVRPDGPVRVSSDVTRFKRDLPGHEHSMPLINIEVGLEHVRAAYDIQLLPVENPDDDARAGASSQRLLVAVKKRGQRGPRRVEITYAVATGQIRELRFVDMPYGPDRLTLTLSLLEERDLGRDFFDHTAHHDAARPVEFEE
jgi:hypothetical protein